MKQTILITLAALSLWGCCNFSRKSCVDCNSGTLPVYNGHPGLHSATNIAVDPSTSVDSTGDTLILKARITCRYVGGNNSARKVRVTVLLPIDATLYYYTHSAINTGGNSCLVWENTSGSELKSGFLTFEKEVIERRNSNNTGDNFDIIVKTSKSGKGSYANFGVFAYSQTPDQTLCDNYWFWKTTPYCEGASIEKKVSFK